jgi:hypothetical protein
MELEEFLRLCPGPWRLPGQDFLETISEAHHTRFAPKEDEEEEAGTTRNALGAAGDGGRERARVEPTWREGTSRKREQMLI